MPETTTVSARIWPGGSAASRPVSAMLGKVAGPDTLYPIAMSPTWSIAIDASQRESRLGAYVLCCFSCRAIDHEPVRRYSSYQRTPATAPSGNPPEAVWLTTID